MRLISLRLIEYWVNSIKCRCVLQVSNDECWLELLNLQIFFLTELSSAPLNLNSTTHPSNKQNVNIQHSAARSAYLADDKHDR